MLDPRTKTKITRALIKITGVVQTMDLHPRMTGHDGTILAHLQDAEKLLKEVLHDESVIDPWRTAESKVV